MHKPVLLHEVVEGLDIKDGDTVLDATVGSGGHSFEICSSYKDINLVAFDADSEAIERSQKKLDNSSCQNILFSVSHFNETEKSLNDLSIEYLDRAMLDLGLNSEQLEASGRGFSFQKDEPLLMTFGKSAKDDLTAKDVVNDWSEDSIEAILSGYGEERFAKRIAKGIVLRRELKPIEKVFELVEIINENTPTWYHHRRIHQATKTFQAIRMATNDEIESLRKILDVVYRKLRVGGRIAVISFHSIEDRLVKRYFRSLAVEGNVLIIKPFPIVPSITEIKENSRARSAKLRIIEKIK